MGQAGQADSDQPFPEGAGLDRATERAMLRRARELSDRDDIDGAIALYEQCIAAGSYSVAPYRGLAALHKDRADAQAESRVLKAALEWTHNGSHLVETHVVDDMSGRLAELGEDLKQDLDAVDEAGGEPSAEVVVQLAVAADEPCAALDAAPAALAAVVTLESGNDRRRKVALIACVALLAAAAIAASAIVQGRLGPRSAQELRFDRDYVTLINAVSDASDPPRDTPLSDGIKAAQARVDRVSKGLDGYSKGNYRKSMSEMAESADTYLAALQDVISTDLRSGEKIDPNAAATALAGFSTAAQDAFLYLSSAGVSREISADPDALADKITGDFRAWQAEVRRREKVRADAIAENERRQQAAARLNTFDRSFRNWLRRYQNERNATGSWSRSLDRDLPDWLGAQEHIDARAALHDELMAMSWPDDLNAAVEPFGAIVVEATQAVESAQEGLRQYTLSSSYDCNYDTPDTYDCAYSSTAASSFDRTEGWKTFIRQGEQLAERLAKATTRYNSRVASLRKQYSKRVKVPPALT